MKQKTKRRLRKFWAAIVAALFIETAWSLVCHWSEWGKRREERIAYQNLIVGPPIGRRP